MKKTKTTPQNKSFEVSLKLILLNKKGEALLLGGVKNGSLSGHYDFPGGRIQVGEEKKSFEKILRREVAEEIGSNVKYKLNKPVSLARHMYVSPSRGEINLVWVLFEGEYLGGKIKISDEHIGIAWKKITDKNLKKLFIRGSLEGASNYLKWKK